ncbi:type II-A CRISPR-associated protein Csn2 [Veillonella montpellierensis]|uniref:type II-A CRISPR-associated protein Csn2 n=1 Tax=Veillonella montpellierensis TaxID=187328 RepID=UPI0023F83DAE|nr:type II-A CRISPR-associated protein Csn2 [Veillonella montpellierensis]
MKVLYALSDIDIVLSENHIGTLFIENMMYFRQTLMELLHQTMGSDGHWVITEEQQHIDCKKSVILVTDFFQLEGNQKPILSKLQAYLTSVADEEQALLYEINDILQRLYHKIIIQAPIEVGHKEFLTAQDLIKAGDFRFELDNLSPLERVVTYLDIISDLLKSKLIILVNLRKYMTEEELKLVYKHCICKKIRIFCIESGYSCKSIDESLETIYTIDNDLCFIY